MGEKDRGVELTPDLLSRLADLIAKEDDAQAAVVPTVNLTEAERDALDQSLADSGCYGFLGDHPDLYVAVERIIAARVVDA